MIPNSTLRHLESLARIGQGKGWGSTTVEQEVHAAISLMPPDALQFPVVLDIGANVGTWSAEILCRCPKSEVYSFEPSSAAFGELTTRLSGQPRSHRIKMGLGDFEGSATLWADRPGSGLSSLNRRQLQHFGLDFTYAEDINVTTVDAWCAAHSIRPNLIKIDVEGLELSVLKGAVGCLHKVEVVQFEFGGGNIDSRTYFQDFFYFFESAGFDLYRLGPKGLRALPHYSEADESFVTTNYFAKRRS